MTARTRPIYSPACQHSKNANWKLQREEVEVEFWPCEGSTGETLKHGSRGLASGNSLALFWGSPPTSRSRKTVRAQNAAGGPADSLTSLRQSPCDYEAQLRLVDAAPILPVGSPRSSDDVRNQIPLVGGEGSFGLLTFHPLLKFVDDASDRRGGVQVPLPRHEFVVLAEGGCLILAERHLPLANLEAPRLRLLPKE